MCFIQPHFLLCLKIIWSNLPQQLNASIELILMDKKLKKLDSSKNV